MTDKANQVLQESTSEGTGDLSLTSVDGFRDFSSAWSTGGTDVFYYFIRNKDISSEEYEVGTGHLVDSTTLRRDTVIESSNTDSLVSFSSGTKEVVNDVPAGRQNNHNHLNNVSAGDHHTAHEHPGDQQATSDIIDDQSNTIFDYSNQYIPDSVIQTTPEPNIPGWQFDGSLNQTSQTSFSYSWNSTYDIYRSIIFSSVNQTNNDGSIRIRFNDATRSDYQFYINNGNQTTSAASIRLFNRAFDGYEYAATVDFKSGPSRIYMSRVSFFGVGNSSSAVFGELLNETSGLSKVTFFDEDGRSTDMKINFYGIDF